MPRKSRNLDFNPPADATRQDIVDTVEDNIEAISMLEEKTDEVINKLERVDKELEIAIGESMEGL